MNQLLITIIASVVASCLLTPFDAVLLAVLGPVGVLIIYSVVPTVAAIAAFHSVDKLA